MQKGIQVTLLASLLLLVYIAGLSWFPLEEANFGELVKTAQERFDLGWCPAGDKKSLVWGHLNTLTQSDINLQGLSLKDMSFYEEASWFLTCYPEAFTEELQFQKLICPFF